MARAPKSAPEQRHIIGLFWRSSRPYRLQRNLALFFPMLAVTINNIAAPYILSLFINRLQTGGISFENSAGLILMYAGLLLFGEVIVWRLALYFCWTFEIAGMHDLYQRIFSKLTRESASFHANRFGGSLVSQSTKLIGSYERFWDMIVWNIVPMATMTIGAIIVIAWSGFWPYALVLLLLACTFAGVVIISSRFLADANTKEAQAATRSSGYLADMITNVMTVKSFGREQYEEKQAARVSKDWHTRSTVLKWGVLKATSLYAVFMAVINIAALLFAVSLASSGQVAVGTVYLLFIYTLNVARQLWEINNIVRTYNRVIGDAADMSEILREPFSITDHSTTALDAYAGKITFDAVTFTHDDGNGEQVFRNFTLTIKPGERVGVVGHSGSGKTTLTRILLRFSDIQQGSIMIDEQDIATVTQQSLHEAIAYVAQEPLLFHRSLIENISYGNPSATREQVIDAARKAHALEFIERLPAGFETLVGERGVKLSGGQRQRIAIARAILKDAPILVLDEATSALDSESEKLIQASLTELMKQRTSIVIAHRLSTIQKMDRIIVLENGAIVEDGSHAELLQKHGTYAKLWSHQSGGFIEE